MLDFDTAQDRLIQAAVRPTHSERVPLKAALGRVLATTVQANIDIPPADNSAMDGYAIRFADYSAGIGLPIQQRCYAGDIPEALEPGNTIRLFTGSLLPAGADTVVMKIVQRRTISCIFKHHRLKVNMYVTVART